MKEKLKKKKDDPCWKNYVQAGMKKKNGKEVPNCVPKESFTFFDLRQKTVNEAKSSSYKNIQTNMADAQQKAAKAYQSGDKETGDKHKAEALRLKKKLSDMKEETQAETSDPRFRKSAGTSYRNRSRNAKKKPDWRYKERGESVEIKEANETYFDTYAAAVQYARAQAEKKGFEVDDEEWFRQINTGPGKPSAGKTVRHNLKLTKDGKPSRKGLAIQVYNRETNKKTYELNYYVS